MHIVYHTVLKSAQKWRERERYRERKNKARQSSTRQKNVSTSIVHQQIQVKRSLLWQQSVSQVRW